MSALIILILISVVVAGIFLGGFLWSVFEGQYDDDYTPSVRILFDDEIKKIATASGSETITQTK